MTAYLLALIVAVGISFLLYCLWNFSRELRPHTSHSSHRVALSPIQTSRLRSQPHAVQLRHQSGTAS